MSSNHIIKKCSKCNQEFLGSFFHKSKTNKDGLYCWCKSCYSSYIKAKRSEPNEALKISGRQSQWYSKNKVEVIKKQVEYARKNKEKVLKYRANWIQEKISTDEIYRISFYVRSLISNSIRRRGYTKRSRSSDILGCTWDEFKRHIELMFHRGMNWDNKGEWEIDHIIPISSAKSEEDVIKLNHFTNLRPLWKSENRSKGAKMENLL